MAVSPPHVELARYYGSRSVQERLAEYCGGQELAAASLTALAAAGYGGRYRLREPEGAVVPYPLSALPALLAQGADVCRSLADSGGTLLLLDVDYNHPGADGWLAEYAASPLAALHAELDAGLREEAHAVAPVDLASLAACVRPSLHHPNPWLLQPRHLRTVSLGLWSAGWRPAAIARLVQSRFEESHGWGGLWDRYDPASRAAFYVRLFCGAASAGLEDGAFDCGRQADLGLCPDSPCGHDLGAAFARRRGGRRDEVAV